MHFAQVKYGCDGYFKIFRSGDEISAVGCGGTVERKYDIVHLNLIVISAKMKQASYPVKMLCREIN